MSRLPRSGGLAATVLLHLMVGLIWLSPTAQVDNTSSSKRLMSVRVTLLSPTALPPRPVTPRRQALPPNAPPIARLASSTPRPAAVMAAAPTPEAMPETLPETLPAALQVAMSAPPPQRQPSPDTYRPATPPDRACADAQIARHYPTLLRERGIEGRVVLRVQVDAQGRTADVQVQQGSGWRLLDQAALLLTQDCRFSPARRGEQTLASWVEYPVRFALDPSH